MQEDFQTSQNNKPIYEPVNVTDPRLNLISDSIKFPVMKGADQITPYLAQATSASSSGLSFNVILPSVRTAVAPVAYIKTKMTINFSGAAGANNYPFALGASTGFGDYPLNSCFDVVNATFNNSSITFEQGQNWDLLKYLIPKKLSEYWQTLTPTQQDVFLKYSEAHGSIYDPIAPFGGATREYNRGGWIDPELVVNENTECTDATAKAGSITVTFVEPVVCPPFCFSSEDGYSDGALDGLTTFRLTYSFKQPSAMRMLRSNLGEGKFAVTSIVVDPSAQLQLFYLTPHASTIIPTRNVRPFLNVIRSTTSKSVRLAAGTATPINLTAIQLGVMPSKMIIGARLPITSQDASISNSWVPISNVSLTLNNRSALLSMASQEQLFQMSKEAGLQHPVEYAVWRGLVNKGSASDVADGFASVGAVGGVVVLDVAKHLAVDDQYAPGSVGQFNFYGQVTIKPLVNTYGDGTSNTNIEVVVLFLNEALLINELGASSIINGCLDKETVLKASQEKSVKVRKNPT
jgi:hypothetical protein